MTDKTASPVRAMPSIPQGILLLLLAATLGACGGASTPAKEAAGEKDADAMKNMPGMSKSPAEAGEKGESGEKGEAVKSEKEGEEGEASATTITFTAAQVQRGKVKWEPAVMGTAAGAASVPGQVVPNEDRTARLGAPASGRVVAVRVSPGDRVARGQILATLVSPEAGIAQSDVAKSVAAVASARAQAAYAASARDRAERLLTLKAIPRQDYERATADAALAQSTLAQAEAEARRARSTASQLGSDSDVSGEITLRSPLSGLVLTRSAVPGTVVEMGAPLVTVTEASSLWLTINAPESMSGLFVRGETLHFEVPAFPVEDFTARITAVGAGLDAATRTLPVRAVITSRAAGRLKPEMLARVVVAGGPPTAAVLLPDAAVQLIGGKPIVFIATPHAKGGATFAARAVEVGARSAGKIAVTRGLAAGDVVVIAGAFAVKAQLQKGSMPDMDDM